MNIDYKLMAELAEQYEYEYQVIDLYGKLIANKLDKEFGIYVGFDESSDCFNIDALGKKIYFRDVKDYDSLKKMISDEIGEDKDDVELKNKFKYIMSDLWVSDKVGEIKDYSGYSFPTMGFFDLLWWVKKGEFLRDGSIGHELMDTAQDYADKYPNDNATFFYPRSGLQYQIRIGEWIDMTTVDVVFSGWQIKFFKNGKIQMKGITDNDWDKILHVQTICEKK